VAIGRVEAPDAESAIGIGWHDRVCLLRHLFGFILVSANEAATVEISKGNFDAPSPHVYAPGCARHPHQLTGIARSSRHSDASPASQPRAAAPEFQRVHDQLRNSGRFVPKQLHRCGFWRRRWNPGLDSVLSELHESAACLSADLPLSFDWASSPRRVVVLQHPHRRCDPSCVAWNRLVRHVQQ
jgi:hypothetical protein